MKKIKKNYTNFILTVIAIAMIGILFKGEINKPAHASSSVETVCVLDRVFVLYESSITQVWTYTMDKGSRPKHCGNI